MTIEKLIEMLTLNNDIIQRHSYSWDSGHHFFHFINGEGADEELDDLWSYHDFEDEPEINVVVVESDDYPGAPCYSETLQLKLYLDDDSKPPNP